MCDVLAAVTAQRNLVQLFSDGEVFAAGEALFVPVRDLIPLVARVAAARKWPAFDAKKPATVADVERALGAAGVRCERVTRRRYHGRERSGLCAMGMDVRELGADGRAARPPPDLARLEKQTVVTVFRCSCGYATVNGSCAGPHGERCGGTMERLPKTTVLRVDDGGAADFDARFYTCANRECKFGKMGRVWLQRETAHTHAKKKMCLIDSARGRFRIVPSTAAA